MLRPTEPAANMSVRECFAMHAMQGLLASQWINSFSMPIDEARECITIEAVRLADHLLAKLNGATATPSRLPEGGTR